MFRASVIGTELIRSRFAAIPGQVAAEVQGAVDQGAADFAARLQTTVPKDTGELASTIRIEAGGRPLSKVVKIGDAEHRYAAATEFGHRDGTKHVPARPFFYTLWRILKKPTSANIRKAARNGFKALS